MLNARCRPSLIFSLRRHFNIQARPHVEDERWPGWQVLVGIETHAQIKSRRKLFSGASTDSTKAQANINVSVFDASFPGTLPSLNGTCVDLAIRAALALKSSVQTWSTFDRKHYFYSDLPVGYQITQRYAPFARGGFVQCDENMVNIQQIQLEQDTGKSTFDPRTRTSFIDLNRAGTGLLEIVTHPDMRSPEEAAVYVRNLQALLRAVGASDGNMELGSFRCDVNVSVNRMGDPPGVRCEIKNLNSVKFMTIAITSEVKRQIDHLTTTGTGVSQETRGFSEHSFETYTLRSKEDAPEYRYMPDPNIPPLQISQDHINCVRATLPALPDQVREKLLVHYGLPRRDVDVLMSIDNGKDVMFDGEENKKGAFAYFEELCAPGRSPKVVSNWMIHELLGQLSARKESFLECAIDANRFGELMDLVTNGLVTRTSAKLIIQQLLSETEGRKSPRAFAEELQLLALPSTAEDDGELTALCRDAIQSLPGEVAAVRKGNTNVLNKIVGKVMKESRGRVDAKKARLCLEELLRSANQ
ncbi:Glutamyl-tRNA amidotransferase B subunit [Pterulicium gracile]|uniref:Glutamyl-tRNA(Gln) amidotransferase subunit B, mitochondrial n=1 Tax=Pterulicium gracile TaxID=1884261 RepID=A0A5C3QX74_9AGAR|nr:Glutamyl-tRNA amidotransferase B subunit [Pterula gracilis]